MFICNPNNPTGALIAARSELKRLCRRQPAGALHRGRILPALCRGGRKTEPGRMRA
ncbi:MAG: hypothetical protein MZV70_29945 [Desulfobacterales bacterium]|nr:hypothetical protein [Desulfobacterales bacterium]